MDVNVKRLTTLLLGVVLSVAGFLVGGGLSAWAARIHPVNEWRSWYVGSGRKINIRREIVADTPGAIRLVGISSTSSVWDANLGKEGLELTKDQLYRCRCRLRGANNNSILFTIYDSAPPHLNRGFDRCFTPSPEWQDYDFTFRANETCRATISLFIGARSIDVEAAFIDVQPIINESSDQTQKSTAEGYPAILSNDNWGMVPVVSSGSSLVKDMGKEPQWVFHRSSRRVDGKVVDAVAYHVPAMPRSNQFLLHVNLASRNASEAEIWFASGNGEISALQTISLDQTASTMSIPISLTTATDRGTLFIRPMAKDDVLTLGQIGIGSFSDLDKGKTLDARYFQLIKDEGVVAQINRSKDSSSPIEVMTSGTKDKVVRLEHPLSITGGLPSRIKLDVKSGQKKSMRLVVAQNHEPWEAIGEPVDVPIDAEWKTVELPFRAMVSEPNARLVISFDDGPGSVNLTKLQMIASETDSSNDSLKP